MADQIVVMRDGRVEQVGAPLELYDHPAQPVRRRLHRLARDELARGRRARPSVSLAAGTSLPAPLAAGDGARCSAASGPSISRSATRGAGPAEVVVVEPTGADTQVVCRVGTQDVIAMLRDRVACRPGDRVGLMPDASRAHLFDAGSGARLAA